MRGPWQEGSSQQTREEQRQPPPLAWPGQSFLPPTLQRAGGGGEASSSQTTISEGGWDAFNRGTPGIDLADAMCWLQKIPELEELKLPGQGYPSPLCVNCTPFQIRSAGSLC